MTALERSGYILMERIFPPISKGSYFLHLCFKWITIYEFRHILGYVIRPGGPSPPELLDLISELGIFGAIIGYVGSYLYKWKLNGFVTQILLQWQK